MQSWSAIAKRKGNMRSRRDSATSISLGRERLVYRLVVAPALHFLSRRSAATHRSHPQHNPRRRKRLQLRLRTRAPLHQGFLHHPRHKLRHRRPCAQRLPRHRHRQRNPSQLRPRPKARRPHRVRCRQLLQSRQLRPQTKALFRQYVHHRVRGQTTIEQPSLGPSRC
jgi:hypothetical protein